MVTGAAKGIGAGIGHRLMREGWSVVGVDIDAVALAERDYAAMIWGRGEILRFTSRQSPRPGGSRRFLVG